MSDLPPRYSPLSEFLTEAHERPRSREAGVSLTERAFLGHLNLRGKPDDPAFLGAVQRGLGVPLPLQPNTFTDNGAVTALWLAPEEWLVVTPPAREGELACALRDALRNCFFAITDVTDGQTILHLSGSHAGEVLAKGCGLDLHPGVFGPGCCAQTVVAKVGVLILWVDHGPSFDLVVRRSFAEYLTRWLEDASQEYGFAVA